MNEKFSAKFVSNRGNTMLNICDAMLLGKNVEDGGHVIKISESYYGEKTVGKKEAVDLLKKSSIINMVGNEIISTAVDLGIGSEHGIKTVDGVPFLIVYAL